MALELRHDFTIAAWLAPRCLSALIISRCHIRDANSEYYCGLVAILYDYYDIISYLFHLYYFDLRLFILTYAFEFRPSRSALFILKRAMQISFIFISRGRIEIVKSVTAYDWWWWFRCFYPFIQYLHKNYQLQWLISGPRFWFHHFTGFPLLRRIDAYYMPWYGRQYCDGLYLKKLLHSYIFDGWYTSHLMLHI